MKLANLWRRPKKSPYGFFSGYSTWEEALKDSTSYMSAPIIEATVKERGQFMSQFDPGDLFVDDRTQQLLSALAVIQQGKAISTLKVLDFGGAAGIYFYIIRRALPHLELDWTVVETKEMVQALQGFEEPHLRWRTSLPEASPSGDKPFDLSLASSSLPYVPEPYDVLQKLIALGRFVITNRMAFIDGAEDKIAVQRVPPEIFTGSYPAWFFSREKFLAFMQRFSQVTLRWRVPQDAFNFEGKRIVFEGYMFECR